MSSQNVKIQLSEFEKSLNFSESNADLEIIIRQFESIDEKNRDKYAIHLYQKMWVIALQAGKISLANNYAKKSINYLVEHKRIPAIKILLNELKEKGLLKSQLKEYLSILEILEGRNKNLTKNDLNRIDLLCDHPEHWKQHSLFLKQYLLLEEVWSYDQWKLCYEYLLRNHFDKEIVVSLYEKALESNNEHHLKKFKIYLDKNKLVTSPSAVQKETVEKIQKTKFNIDYDQIAFDLLSGKNEPSEDEQLRVINSLKFISEEDLKSKGTEMLVAFELLGMEKVVFSLCEKLIAMTSDVKIKAGIYFVWAQALLNNEEYYKVMDLIDDVIQKEPLVNDELIAIMYLKAEAYIKVKNIKAAKNIFLEIKKQNPNYRMVAERLKSIEQS